MIRKLLVALVAAVSAFAITPSTQAAIAMTFALPQSPFTADLVNGVDGIDFTPTVNLTITGLGWYDHNGDGLTHPHPVGIYVTSTQTLVAPSATITTTSALDKSNNFRFEPVVPFLLTAGVTYTLAGYGEGPTFDPYVNDPSGGITFGPKFDFVRYRSGASSGLLFPTEQSQVGVLQDLFFGPNFQYTVVPEPYVLGFLCIGLGLAAATRHRRPPINQLECEPSPPE